MSSLAPILLTLGAALVGAGLTMLNTNRQAAQQAAADVWKRKLEHRQRQLSDFYGPVQMLRGNSSSLRRFLPLTKPDPTDPDLRVEWRLVHHVGDVRRAWDAIQAQRDIDLNVNLTPEQVQIAKDIIEVGDETCELLDTQAGLIEGKPPRGIERFQEHHRRMRAGWDAGQNQPVEDSNEFPGAHIGNDSHGATDAAEDAPRTKDNDVDIALADGERVVREELSELLNTGTPAPSAMVTWVMLVIGVATIAGAGVIALLSDTDQPPTVIVQGDGAAVCGELSTADGVMEVGDRTVTDTDSIEFVESCN